MNEDDIEQALLQILSNMGWVIEHGPDIEPNGTGERDYTDTVLSERLYQALQRLNPDKPGSAISEARNKLIRNRHTSLIDNNRDFHRLLVGGVPVEYRGYDGDLRNDIIQVIDFEHIERNEFLAVNQLTVVQGDIERRPDVVLFVNGLPLVIIELKNATDARADRLMAWRQLQTYKREISDIFRFNELIAISDGIDAEMGTMTSPFNRMMPWKTIDGQHELGSTPMMEVLARGVFNKYRLLDIIHNFIVFERADNDSYIKKVAAYHQYWVVNKALQRTLRASSAGGDGRAGVVWHTQGSGKSLSMVFFAGKLMHSLDFHNPTIVVVTDRNDLDGQLFGGFASCCDLLGEMPRQAESRRELRRLLSRQAGGIIFTTIQKFSPEGDDDSLPVLTDRRNVIVMADEAHRSQYGFRAKINTNSSNPHLVYGYAKYMRDALPNASYIGFTGTPIETSDKSTPAVFGDYIDVYDVKQAVEDGATVPIYYESRLIDLGMDESTKAWLDNEVDDLIGDEDNDRQNQFKREWAQKEAIVGNESRLDLIAHDIVDHFEARQANFEGKAMIVTMSRQIAVDLYDKIIAIRPNWHDDDDMAGTIKVVITGAAGDPEEMQPHIRNKQRCKQIEKRMKNPNDSLKLVIVCDMWLTGFDVPCLNTMYLDKPLKGYNLMQTIARVNRVYPGKNGGLIVDYMGIAGALRDAMNDYTASGGHGKQQLDVNEAVRQMLTRYEVVRDLFGHFNYKRYFDVSTQEKLQILLDAVDYIAGLPDGEKRLRQTVLELSKAFALAMPQPQAIAIRDEVAFFQAVKARFEKISGNGGGVTDDEYRMALKQVVDQAIAPKGVIDVFAAAGLDAPEISILSDEFFAEVRGMKRKNLAVAALERLLKDQIKANFGMNAVKDRKFSEMLQEALNKYKNGTIEAAQIIEELIEIGKEIRQAEKQGEEKGLTPDEELFYDALVDNDSAAQVMKDDQLCNLAKMLVEQVRKDATVDWTRKKATQAKLRVNVKKLLGKYGYPPDQQQLATDLVLEQAKRYGDKWNKRAIYDSDGGASIVS